MDLNKLGQKWLERGYKEAEELNGDIRPLKRTQIIKASLAQILNLKKSDAPMAEVGYQIGSLRRLLKDRIAIVGNNPNDDFISNINHRLREYGRVLNIDFEHTWVGGSDHTPAPVLLKFEKQMDKAAVSRIMADPALASVHQDKNAGTLSGMLYGGSGLLGMVAPNLYAENLPKAAPAPAPEPAKKPQKAAPEGEEPTAGATQAEAQQLAP